MSKNAGVRKIAINFGVRIGRLEIGDLVFNVQEHSLFEETPKSYLQQGRLREVICDCGTHRLISESILASGRVRSCGCLRQEIHMRSSEAKIDRLRKKAAIHANNNNIKIEQLKLKTLQLAPVYMRDEKKIEDCSIRIKKLFAQKALLARKESHKETWERIKNKVAQTDLTK